MKKYFTLAFIACATLIGISMLLARVSSAHDSRHALESHKSSVTVVSEAESLCHSKGTDRESKRFGPKVWMKLDQLASTRPGQSATFLPDGRLLFIGGEGPEGPLATAEIKDINSGEVVTANNALNRARAWHSATMLPDGNVLVLGGIEANGHLVDMAEIFNVSEQRFESISISGLTTRAHHTATLLMDGNVLIAGGLSDKGRSLSSIELLDLKTRSAVTLPTTLISPRQNHSAYFLPDGNVLFWGGVDKRENEIKDGEIFDVEKQTLNVAGEDAKRVDGGSPYLTVSAPKDGETSVPRDSRIALRFSKPLRVQTLNGQNATLSGPEGSIAVKVVPAENGMLGFVTPAASLAAGSMYTLSINNATDNDGSSIPPTSITFMTVGSEMQEHAKHEVQRAPDAPPEFDSPQSADAANRWRGLPPLQAEPGITAFSGQVLRVSGQPLPNVTIQIGDNAVRTDATGRFLLTNVPSGHQEFLINGETASRPNKLFATCEEGIDIVASKTNVLSYTIWLPVVDTQHAMPLQVPTTSETIITNPLMPGLEMHIPAGVRLRTHNGTYLTSVALTPVPLDRTPLPLPPGTSYYFTPQTHDSVIETVDGSRSVGIRIVFPNVQHLPPGTQVDLFDYSSEDGWYVYGQGTVTRDGKQVVPNPGVGLQKLNCNNSMANPYPPDKGPFPCGDHCVGGDPVDLATGLFVYKKTDLVLPDTIPITLTRTYRQDGTAGSFGAGNSHPYEMYLWFSFSTWIDLILPDGGRVRFDETSPGSFIYQHSATPSQFYKSTLTRDPDGNYSLKLINGTTYHFFSALVCCNMMTHQYLTGLDWIQDRFGNKLTIVRDTAYQIQKLVSPNGRWVSFTYDTGGHITQARDSVGRTVSYVYNASYRLIQVTDASNGITQYTWDPYYSRMLTIKDPRNIVYLTNEYDTNGRVRKQTLADGGFYQFAYTLDGNGKVTQTVVTDPRGYVRRVSFNASGYVTSEIFALGTPDQQNYTYERQAGTNLLLSRTDPLGRKTGATYDAQGNLTSVTKLADTPNAVTAFLTYEPMFSQLASITDFLNHTTSFGYDSNGNLVSITDPLNHQMTLTYSAAGQLLTATDPLQHTVQYTYDLGDLVARTDPLNRTVNRYVDGAGRVSRVTNPLGSAARYEFNASNQTTRAIDPLLGATVFAYDASGNLSSVTDARNNVTNYIYDNMDRIATRRDPLLHDETYQYDLNGNVTHVTDRKGQLTQFAYDAHNRRTQVTYADMSTTSYTYDAANRLTQIVDSVSGTITYTYDNLDHVSSVTTPQGSVSYIFDAAGRRTSMTVAGQPTVSYSYDNANRLTQITQGAATVTIVYDAAGRRTSLTLPNGLVTEYEYDAASQLISLTYKQGPSTLGDLTYEYDANGRRTKIGGSFARSITPPSIPSASYNAANQQLAFGDQTLAYDLNGNLLNDGVNSYTWDARNRLISVSGPNVNASFQYDALGRRISKTVNGNTTSFLYDGASVVQEQSAQLGTANTLNGTMDERFYRTDSSGASSPLADGSGSTLTQTNADGSVQSEYSYSAFGATAQAGTDSGGSAQYTGRENDETGLYYYRARYYSPTLQRFISEDPMRFAGGDANFYAYVNNDPMNYRDPWGLCKEPPEKEFPTEGEMMEHEAGKLAGEVAIEGTSLTAEALPEALEAPLSEGPAMAGQVQSSVIVSNGRTTIIRSASGTYYAATETSQGLVTRLIVSRGAQGAAAPIASAGVGLLEVGPELYNTLHIVDCRNQKINDVLRHLGQIP